MRIKATTLSLVILIWSGVQAPVIHANEPPSNEAQEGQSGTGESPTDDASYDHRVWMSMGALGLGATAGFGSFLTNAQFGVSWQSAPSWLWTARVAQIDEFCLAGGRCQSMTDIALLAGKATNDDTVHISLSAGPSMVRGEAVEEVSDSSPLYDGDVRERRSYTTFGIGLHAQLHLTLLPAFSIGIDVPANLNLENPYAAGMISVRLGKLN